MIKLYKLIWQLGSISGCHQKSDRSFFIGNYQFPICARCTGIFVGYIIGVIIYPYIKLNALAIAFALGLMFIDWYLQYKNIISSTNLRRLFTGLLCGTAYIQIIINIFIKLILVTT